MVLALAVAFTLSFAELLTKYRAHIFRDLLNVYLGIYLLLNCFFAYLVYALIPLITSSVGQGSFEHAMIAGFGYAVVLRAKLITVTVDKRQYALGPEILYTGLMNYVSFHLENRMRSKRDAIRDRLLQKQAEILGALAQHNQQEMLRLVNRITSAPSQVSKATTKSERNVMSDGKKEQESESFAAAKAMSRG